MNSLDTQLTRLVDEALQYGKRTGKKEAGAMWYLVGQLGMDVPINYFDSEPVEDESESVGC